jgi:hypothetical protein
MRVRLSVAFLTAVIGLGGIGACGHSSRAPSEAEDLAPVPEVLGENPEVAEEMVAKEDLEVEFRPVRSPAPEETGCLVVEQEPEEGMAEVDTTVILWLDCPRGDQ